MMIWNTLIAISMVCMCLAVWLLFWRMSQLPKDIGYQLRERSREQEQRAERESQPPSGELEA